MIRGILEPLDEDEISDRKDREHHNFVTKSSMFAGEYFQLNEQELKMANKHLEEMDRVDESTEFVSAHQTLTR
jgi:ABC-type transporter Mla subunit MlaD